MAKITMLEAITRAHAWEMSHDPSVVVLGEDVGVNGGVFRATAGLQEQFGKDRVQDTPLAEGMIAGMSIGMASQGLRPVAEIQFMGFIYPAMDQIANHMARLRNRTRSRHTRPRASLRVPRGDVGASCRAAGGVSVIACARVRIAAGGDSGSGPRDISRARAAVPADTPGSR